jgi:MSHA biogenesis protein MshL
VAAAAALALWIAGCAKPPLPESAQSPRDAAVSPEAPPAQQPDPPPPVSTAIHAAPTRRAEPRFDVAVNEAPLREFLAGLVDDTPYNLVVHPEIAGTVSLTLRGVTVRETLEAVREIAPIDFHTRGSTFFVGPAGLQTRSFQIDYLNVQRTSRSETRVNSGQVSDGTRTSQTSAANGPIITEGDRAGTVSGSQVETSSLVDFWKELQQTLASMVSVGAGRSVVVSPHVGMVVVRAAPSEMRDVENYLAEIQRRLGKQVILEAKILEVALSDGFQAGINWAKLVPAAGDVFMAGQTGGGSLLANGVSEIFGNTGNLDPRLGSLPSGTDTSAFGGAFTFSVETGSFSAFVELLEMQGDVHTLSNPRIATVNNQKAVIKVGSDEFFVTDVSSTTVTGTATTTTPDITLTPFFSGIALDVTPQIGLDDRVTLHVHPSVSKVTDQIKEITVGGETQELPLALSTIRESDSVVRARSGQIVVIGGLIEDAAQDDRGGLPFISRVPYVGSLFRQTQTGANRRELVILLKPLVVDDATWDGELADTEQRLEELKPGTGRLLRENPSGEPTKPDPW